MATMTPRLTVFTEASAEDLAELRNRVERHDGTTRVLVHPWHVSRDPHDIPLWWNKPPLSKHLDRVHAGYERVLRACPESTPPLICFLECEKIEGAGNELQAMSSQPLWIIPTGTNTSQPVPFDRRQNGGYDGRHAWKGVEKFFRDMQIRTVIVSGEFLGIEGCGDEYTGCVGRAISHLRTCCSVKISCLCFPDNRGKIRKLRRKLHAHSA